MRAGLAYFMVLLLAGCGGGNGLALMPVPADGFAFAAFGDEPYSGDDLIRVQRVIREMNAQELQWVIHVGDILWYPCSDEMLQNRHDLLGTIRHPVVYTPGDNDWADCHEGIAGRYAPLDRLDQLRSVFFPTPDHQLGGTPIALQRQSRAFPENVMWAYRGVIFATVHVVGSHNGRNPFAQRGPADDEEVERREAAAIEWLKAAFSEAQAQEARALVLAWQAAPGFLEPPGHPWRVGYERLLETLEVLVADWGRPVLLIHGDDHEYLVDRPLTDRRNGRKLANFTRLEVMGTPRIGWVRVIVEPEADEPFSMEPHHVGRGWWYFRSLVAGP